MKLPNTIFVNGFMDAVSELLKEKMPMGTAWPLTKFIEEIEDKFKTYEKARVDLVTKYAKKDKKGEMKTNEDGTAIIDKYDEFQKEYSKLLEIEEEYSLEPIKLPDTIELMPQHLVLLKRFEVIKE